MRLAAAGTFIVLAAALAVPVRCAAQEPVKSFDALNTRLKPGDRVWVTDAQGREVEGRIQGLLPDALTLKDGAVTTFAARDVMLIRQRQHDSLANGALIGLAVGGGLVSIACIATAGEDEEHGWCWLGAAVYAGVGAAIGVGIDALIPGKKLVVYRAPGAAGSARLSISPIITPRARGAAVSVAF